VTGALSDSGFNVVDGSLFAISILTILGAHELGHYFVARYYKAPVTLPYFIPLPILSPMGTLGAVIKLKAPFVNRRSLFDVGIAGPLAGLVFAVPILLIGLSMSTVGRCPVPGQCMQEGNSLFYSFAKYLVLGKFLPAGDIDVQLSPVAWAGWVGLFVTAINLLPAGQLDGGHVIFALFGKRAAVLARITVVCLAILALPALLPTPLDLSFLGVPGLNYPGYGGWIVWVGLIYLTGVNHPVPLNDISGIGNGRKALGLLSIVLFILLFTPLPFSVS
jgi:membrane-associated protease RseP (regulator of RpoE activity)